jgi:aldehyde dehydrogenase (NAD+)
MTEAARESSVHAPLAAASLVGGDWLRGGDAVEVVSASDLDEIVTVGVHAPLTAVDDAVGAARSAAGTWSRVTPGYRADVLSRIGIELNTRREELGTLLAREEGKVLPEAIAEDSRASQIFHFFAGEALRLGGSSSVYQSGRLG